MEYSKLLATTKLILAIQSPTLEECCADGYNASLSNSLDDNPFVKGTTNFHHWQEGWWHGFHKGKFTEKNQLGINNFASASNDRSLNEKNLLKTATNSRLK